MTTFTSYNSTFTFNNATKEVFWGSTFIGYADTLEAAQALADDQCEIEMFER